MDAHALRGEVGRRRSARAPAERTPRPEGTLSTPAAHDVPATPLSWRRAGQQDEDVLEHASPALRTATASCPSAWM